MSVTKDVPIDTVSTNANGTAYTVTCGTSSITVNVVVVKVDLTRTPPTRSAKSSWTHTKFQAEDYKTVITVATIPTGHENLVNLLIDSVAPTNAVQGTLQKISDTEWHYISLGESKIDKLPGKDPRDERYWDVTLKDSFSGETIDLIIRSVFTYCTLNEGDYDMALEYVKWKYATFISLHSLTVGTYDATVTNYGQTTVMTGTVTYGSMAYASENILLSTILHEDVHVDQPFDVRFNANIDYIAYMIEGNPAPPTTPPPGSEGKEWGEMEYPGHNIEKVLQGPTGINNDVDYLNDKNQMIIFFSFLINNCN